MAIALCLITVIVIIAVVVSTYNKNTANGKPTEEYHDITKSTPSNHCKVGRATVKRPNKSLHAQKNFRYLRLERHKRIWAILRYVTTLKGVYNSKNFYDLDKSISEYKVAYDRLYDKDYTPSKEEISIAIRFCKIENKKGQCEHRILEEEEQSIYNWRNIHLNASKILPQVIISFKTYWAEVLTSYKRPSARKNRINYLINHLTEMKTKENLKNILEFEKEADKLISYYNSLLTKD